MIELSAKYYDGQTSAPRDVVVRAESGGIVRIDGVGTPQEFSLSEVRISPRLGSTVRSLTFPGGAKCETTDQEAVDALQRMTGGRVAGVLVHRLESSWRWALGALAFVVIIVVVGFHWGIPWLARYVAMNVPEGLAFDLGRGTLATLDRAMLEPTRLAELRQVELKRRFSRMAEKYERLPLRLEFRRAAFPNAFALPDGTVVMTDSLVELAKNDAQIVSVLAHEVGHVHHRHALRMALESSSIALLASVTLGDATQITALAGTLPALMANARYSRAHETEADRFALDYLNQSGIARRHFADMLRLLGKELGPEQKGALTYLASHPPTEERVRLFEE